MNDHDPNPPETKINKNTANPPSGASVPESQQRHQQPGPNPAFAGPRLNPTKGDSGQAPEELGWEVVDRAEVSRVSKKKPGDMAEKNRKTENVTNVGGEWEIVERAEVSGGPMEKDAGKQTRKEGGGGSKR